MSLFPHNIVLYKENPKMSTENLLDLMNKFRKAVRYKVSIKTKHLTFYTLKMNYIKKIMEVIPFVIAPKIIKYILTNLTKD